MLSEAGADFGSWPAPSGSLPVRRTLWVQDRDSVIDTATGRIRTIPASDVAGLAYAGTACSCNGRAATSSSGPRRGAGGPPRSRERADADSGPVVGGDASARQPPAGALRRFHEFADRGQLDPWPVVVPAAGQLGTLDGREAAVSTTWRLRLRTRRRNAFPGCVGDGSEPATATASARSVPTVSAAQVRLAPMPPDGPRLIQPTTYVPVRPLTRPPSCGTVPVALPKGSPAISTPRCRRPAAAGPPRSPVRPRRRWRAPRAPGRRRVPPRARSGSGTRSAGPVRAAATSRPCGG